MSNLIMGQSKNADRVSAPYVYGDVAVETERSHDVGRPATMAAKGGSTFWDVLLGIGLFFFNRFAIEKDLEKTRIVETTELERIHAKLRADTAAYEARLRETMILAEAGARRLGDTSFHDAPNVSWGVSEQAGQDDGATVSMNGYGASAPSGNVDPFDVDLGSESYRYTNGSGPA